MITTRTHVLTLCLAFVACSKPAVVEPPSLLATLAIAAGAQGCAAGGLEVDTGLDKNHDQVLEADEITSRQALCNGVSPAPTLLATTALPSGDETCAQGGTRIEAGTDANGDGALQASEVTQTQVVCNGAPGTPGTLLTSTALPKGDEECPAGGTRIAAGLDTNRDGVLQDEEISQAASVCEAAGTLLSLTTLPVGDATCASGGLRIESGADTNADGTLQGAEVTQAKLVCNGATGDTGETGATGGTGETGAAGAPGTLVRTTPLAKGDVACPAGGTRIEAGPDTNRDGTLQAGEVSQTVDACNPPGTLTTLTTLPVGDTACPAGGLRVEAGADVSGDGTLQAAEVTQTRNVCNGGSPKLALQLFPYNGFNGGFDPQSFTDGRLVRRITSGALEMATASLGSRNAGSELDLVNGDGNLDLSADIKVVSWGANGSPLPYVAARLFGEYYNAGFANPADRVGDVFVSFQLDSNRNCTASLNRCADATCGNATNLGGVSLATGVDYSVFHNLRLQYDGSATFVASLDGGTPQTLTGPARLGPAGSGFRFLGTSVRPNGVGDGNISALFDNVKVDGAAYDDFSGKRIDPARWNGSEAVRDITGGALRLTTAAGEDNGAGTEMNLTNAGSYDAIAADVKLTEFEGTGALRWARLGGAFYNDGKVTAGAGAGSQTSDVIAVVGMSDTQAFYVVGRCLDPTCDGIAFLTTDTTVHGIPANLLGTVTPFSVHTLFVQFDGAKFTFQLDGDAPVRFDPVAAGAPVFQGFANSPSVSLASGVNTDVGETGYVTALFDNLRVGSRTVVGP